MQQALRNYQINALQSQRNERGESSSQNKQNSSSQNDFDNENDK